DQAEIGQRRVAAADGRQAEAHVAEAVRPGRALELRGGVPYRDEALAPLATSDGLRQALEEVLLEDVGLERRPRLRGHDEHGPREVDPRLARADLGRVRRVQHRERGPSGLLSERNAEDLGTEARASHTEEQDVRDARLPDVLGDAPKIVDAPTLLVYDSEPPEPVCLVGAGREGG